MLDVSRHASISEATVSRILNGTGQVKGSTRQKVFKAMRAFDYWPNFLAHSLANYVNNSVGLIVSTFGGFYLSRLLQQISRRTESRGKQLIVTDGHDTPGYEREAVQILADRQYDATILYVRYISEKMVMSLMNSIAMPLLAIDHDVNQARSRAIFFEQEDTAYQAVNCLISQGRSDVACTTVPGHTSTGRSRLMGHRKTLEKNDIPWDPDGVKYDDSTMTQGYEACRELLEEGVKFSTLLACSDDIALGVSKALHQAGLRIPADVSPFGFDDAPNARWLKPGLSTVYLPIDTMITAAADQAIRLANGEGIGPIPPFTGKLILRDSVTLRPYFK